MAVENNISVTLCSDNDIPAAFSAMSRGFTRDAPFFDIYFPDHDTGAGAQKGSTRLLTWKRSAPQSKFSKAVLRADGEEEEEKVIGFAVWTLMKEAPPADLDQVEDVGHVWPDAGDAEYMRRLWKKYVVPRSEMVKASNGAGVCVLELLSVDKAYQRRGAGLALVKWGTDWADELGIESIVESTPIGRRTYEKVDMCAEIEEMDLDTGVEFAERRKPILTFLRRAKK